ncbi:large conductance mechanosensitive channel protein MscL [Paenibacillus sp. NPDC056579]|uniref:large conductance mechanosensitive channel protein MscL n=1 Tax=unclassified Paenibacillus TaxID=185978 RepID=UPI001EF7FA75|nr:large conductance mechanosensitive channel protein MscL [Paenibacillus sp. H1-7]
MIKEFKEFAMKGNMIDLAIGVIIGGAFSKVVTSIVSDLVMPPIGLLLNRVNFSDLFFSLDGKSYDSLAAAKAAGAPTLNFGLFFSTMIDFLILSFVIFITVKQINRLRKKQEDKPDPKKETKECPECLSDIPKQAVRCKFCTAYVEPAANLESPRTMN